MPEPTRVSYDLTAVLTQINNKMDTLTREFENLRLEVADQGHRLEERIAVIEAKPAPIPNGDHRVGLLEAEYKDIIIRVQTLEQREQARFGVSNWWKAMGATAAVLLTAAQIMTTILIARGGF